MTNQLIISNTSIKQDTAGRYSLNDLHKASGGKKRHQPSDWLRLEQTNELIAEILKPEITGIKTSEILSAQNREVKDPAQKQAPVISKSGRYGGTYVCKELVYSYAMWISAAFSLKVIRAYDALVSSVLPRKSNFRQATAKQLTPLRQTAERLIAHGVGNIYPDIWKHVHAEFGVQHINELLPEQIPLAISYLDALEGEYIPKQGVLPEPDGITFTEDETLALVTMCNAANFAQQEAKAMYPAFVDFGSRFTGSIYDIAHSNGIFVRNGTKVLMDKLSGLRLSGKAWDGALNRLTMNA